MEGNAIYQNIKNGEIQILEMPCKGWRKISYDFNGIWNLRSDIKYQRIK